MGVGKGSRSGGRSLRIVSFLASLRVPNPLSNKLFALFFGLAERRGRQ